MTPIPFGNDPAKIDRYRAFWKRSDVNRPIVGFSMIGWFHWTRFLPRRIGKDTAISNLICWKSRPWSRTMCG